MASFESGAAPLDDQVEQSLRAAYASVGRGAHAEATLQRIRTASGAFQQYGYAEHAVLFHGNALDHLDVIVEQLTRSALADGGHKADAVRAHVARACRECSADDAVAAFAAALASPPRAFNFGEAIRTYYEGDGPVSIGKCLVHRGICAAVPEEPPVAVTNTLSGEFPSMVITTVVTAHDEDSAYLRAVDNIDEAKALLLLVAYREERQRRANFITTDGGHLTGAGSGGERLSPVSVGNASLLFAPYTHLSDAAAKDEPDRTDWERRTIAAARWHYHAATTSWPSAALTASMTVFETLLLPPGYPTKKGKRISKRLHELSARVPNVDDIRTWFPTLYDRRNDAIHEGKSYRHDLEVGRLLALAHTTIRWAACHLDPDHRGWQQEPCTTLDDVLSDHS